MVKVSEVMSTEVEFCTPDDNVYEVSVKMKEDNVGMIPIVENGKVLGIITDRDIVIHGTADKKPGSTSVSEVMSTGLITVTSDTTCEDAAALMSKHQVRRLPVVDNGKLVGVVSLGDLATTWQTDTIAGDTLTNISKD